MKRVRVPIYNTPAKSAMIDPAATEGAIIGRNVWNEDGSLFAPGAAATPAEGNTVAVTIWRLVLEKPPNVVALAETTTTGLYVVTGDGTSATRTLADSATIEWTNGDGVAGNPSPNLKDLPDAGAGTFKLLTRDAKGRLSGTADGDTDDVSEGATNLYHTAVRVRGTLLAGLTLASSAAITASDSVLSALGKLQAAWNAHTGRVDNPHSVTAAQVGAVASVVAGANITVDATDPQNPVVNAAGGGGITQTIADGDTTHAPSGDAVFDAIEFIAASGTGPPSVNVNRSTAIGYSAQADYDCAALGYNAKALSGRGVAIGGGSKTLNFSNNVAVGYSSVATGGYSTALGAEASVTGSRSVSIGYKALSYYGENIAIGANSKATNSGRSIAIGTSAEAKNTESIALGFQSISDRDNSLSIGSSTIKRQIVNVAPATQDNDAVTLSQLLGQFSGLQNAADDSAAAVAGVQVGRPYRNGSALMVRVA